MWILLHLQFFSATKLWFEILWYGLNVEQKIQEIRGLIDPQVHVLLGFCFYGFYTMMMSCYLAKNNCVEFHILQIISFLRIIANNQLLLKILLFVYKALSGIAPTYISVLEELKTASRYNLRNSDDTLLLSNPSFKSRIILGDRSFKNAGPKLWNELLRTIRYANTVHIFKRLLKTHLFRKAYLL